MSASIVRSRTSGAHISTNESPVTALDLLDNNSIVTESSKFSYKLFAVVNHIGSIDTGHYTCYIAHPPSSLWYLCDDTTISKVSLSKVLNSHAYLLFYIRETRLQSLSEENNLEDSM